MWNKPHLLNAAADLLILSAGAAVLAGAVVWLVRMPSLPVQQVVFAQALQHTQRTEVEQGRRDDHGITPRRAPAEARREECLSWSQVRAPGPGWPAVR